MLVNLLRSLKRWPAAVIALTASLIVVGCGYTSEYTLPAADGRARPVWRDSDVVMETAGLTPPPACWSEVGRLTSATVEDGRPVMVVTRAPSVWWAPRYYGAPIVVLTPGLVPRLLQPPLFLPRLVLNAFRGSPRPSFSTPSLRLGRGGGGGNSGDLGKAVIVLAVIAILVLAVIGVYLAADQPESSASSRTIDEVNALNDLARTPDTVCSLVGGAP